MANTRNNVHKTQMPDKEQNKLRAIPVYTEQTNDQNKKQVCEINETMNNHDNHPNNEKQVHENESECDNTIFC